MDTETDIRLNPPFQEYIPSWYDGGCEYVPSWVMYVSDLAKAQRPGICRCKEYQQRCGCVDTLSVISERI